jgi:hypothetical protein
MCFEIPSGFCVKWRQMEKTDLFVCETHGQPTQPSLFPDYGLIIINIYIKNSLFSGICNWKNVNLLRKG